MTVKDTGNRVVTGLTVAWASSNPALATVSAGGLVTGQYPGSVTVTATAKGVTGTAKLTITASTQPSVVEMHSVLDSTNAAFMRLAAQTRAAPTRVLALTAEWALGDPRVASVDLIDSTYLELQLKSGMLTAYGFDEMDTQGKSVARGGGSSSPNIRLSRFGSAAQVISNKKVLICAGAYSEFYNDAEMQKIVDRFEKSGLGFQVTLLKGAACNYRTITTFSAYGLVIIDTHGVPNGFMTGERVPWDSSTHATESTAKAAIDGQIAPGTYDKLASGDLAVFSTIHIPRAEQDPEWWKHVADGIYDQIWVTSKFVRALPKMPSTIVFGNMCYSGYISRPSFNPPTGFIQPAFMSTGVRAYYAYALLDGTSLKVTNTFSKLMEDSLTYALVVDGDSTGTAHLRANTTEFEEVSRWGVLRLRRFGAVDFSYFRVAINPDTAMGEFGTPVQFTAETFGTAPVRTSYEWDFGDGTPLVRIDDKSVATHTYQSSAAMGIGQPSVFTVKLTLYNNTDAATRKKFATAKAAARIVGKSWRLTEFVFERATGTSVANFTGLTQQFAYQPTKLRLDSLAAKPQFTIFTLLAANALDPLGASNTLGTSALFFRTPDNALVTASPSTFVFLAAHTLTPWPGPLFPQQTIDVQASFTQTGSLSNGTVSGVAIYSRDGNQVPDNILHVHGMGQLDAQFSGNVITGYLTVTTRQWGLTLPRKLTGERVEVYRFTGTRF